MTTKSWLRPLKIGTLVLKNNLAFSPLAGCSDLPYRKSALPFRPGLFFCEMVKMDALVRHDRGTYRILSYTHDMHPIGAQICGSSPKLARQAAKIIEDLGFDVVDLNCGCPVDKVTKDNSGSGLLKFPEKIGEILSEMKAAVSIPVTVKIRVGWNNQEIVAPKVTRIAEEAGAQAIFVHGRTREQAYTGHANRDLIRACVQQRQHIPVFGNGDIFDGPSALDMFERTGCDGVLLSRGTLGAPWLAEDVAAYLSNTPPPPITEETIHDCLLHHFHHSKSFNDDKKTLVDMRKVATWFFRKKPEMAQLRDKINRARTLDEIELLINTLCYK